MSPRKKLQNILYSLQDRELNSSVGSRRLRSNILSQLIRSDRNHYEYTWKEESSNPIAYDYGFLYLNHYTSSYTIYGDACKPSRSHTFKPVNARREITDLIAYNNPVCTAFENCECKQSLCSCGTSRFILCLTKDNWLCQYSLSTGALIKEVYVKHTGSDLNFAYCDWDIYASSVILSSGLKSCYEEYSSETNIVAFMAIFTIFPLEFSALFEIKRSVFGKYCEQVNNAEQLLFIGMGHDRVCIYSLLDILAEGNLCPFKIGEEYIGGKVGMYPTGLPVNLNIESTPPLLFDIQCYGQSVCFGGFPYYCIYPDPNKYLRYVLQNVKDNALMDIFVDRNLWIDEPNIVTFFPDNSNRIILKEVLKVQVFDISNSAGKLKLNESYSMKFEGNQENETNKSAWSFISDRSIMATAYDDELQLFGILGTCLNDPQHIGFINLYNSLDGEKVKSIQLKQILCEHNDYQLHIDCEVIIIIEKNYRSQFYVFVYQLAEKKDIND